MKKVDELLADYAAYHRTRGNVACHFVGVPLIMFGLFSMLQEIRIAFLPGIPLTVAEVLILLATVYYLVLDFRFAALMMAGSVLLDGAAYFAGDYRIGLGAFIVGWIVQGIGHGVYEKRSPAFFRNLVHLLIGPIFLINEAFHFRTVISDFRI
jgi:uncharacterized membrane protein YGL010W